MNDKDENEFFSERAAIREFDGGQSRAEAEAAARKETEIHIFQCMVRLLINWNENEGKRDDVVKWLDARDPELRKRYADALNEQIRLGNKGGGGEWKSQTT